MAQKFQAEDLFRIAEEHLSDQERLEFTFTCEVSAFRKATDRVFQKDIGLDEDERRLLERIFRQFARGGFFPGGR